MLPRIVAFVAFVAATSAHGAEIPHIIRLWPGAAPGSEKVAMMERITERSQDPNKRDRIFTQIVEPLLVAHRPEKPNGATVIIAPGGGYQRIVIDKEGPDTSAWLNRIGVTAFVLKYRLPDEGHENGQDVALQDAQRAVRVIRAHAKDWGLDPARIGFLGYSAGGHLTASLTFFSDKRVYAPVDAADELSARPDFSVIGYAGSGGRGTPPDSLDDVKPSERLRWDYKIEAAPGKTYPPTFLLHADDDPTVPADNSAIIYLALKQAKTPVEMHIFKRGGHGFGIRDTNGPNTKWPDLCADWLREIGVLREPTAR